MKITLSFFYSLSLCSLIIVTLILSYISAEIDLTYIFIAIAFLFFLFVQDKTDKIIANQNKIITLLSAKQ